MAVTPAAKPAVGQQQPTNGMQNFFSNKSVSTTSLSGKKKVFSKKDINAPSDFRHVLHLGYSSSSGFEKKVGVCLQKSQ